jgi:hypothetical protein
LIDFSRDVAKQNGKTLTATEAAQLAAAAAALEQRLSC